MNMMNENFAKIELHNIMGSTEGWGRTKGRIVFNKLINYVEAHSGVMIFRVSLEGVKRVDISFASETIVELARRFKGKKGFCFINLNNSDMVENWEAAAERKAQPLIIWQAKEARVIGVQPRVGLLGAFNFAMKQPQSRAAEFAAATPGMTIANASNKFKLLWEQGFLLRREDMAGSGGVEFVYYRIG
jgi:hypothetical protein